MGDKGAFKYHISSQIPSSNPHLTTPEIHTFLDFSIWSHSPLARWNWPPPPFGRRTVNRAGPILGMNTFILATPCPNTSSPTTTFGSFSHCS